MLSSSIGLSGRIGSHIAQSMLESNRTAVLQHQRVKAEAAEAAKGTETAVHSPAPRTLAINMVTMPFLGYGAQENATLARQEEYKVSLRKNLAHPFVQHIHLLTTNSTDTQVRFMEFTNNSKLVIYEVERLNNTRNVFEYVSRNLLGKDAMIVNADIYLAAGFDKIDAAVMDQQNIMYAISRHLAPERDVTCGKEKKDYRSRDMCQDYKFVGSHDAFLFRLHKPLTEEFLQHMDFPYPNPGMEGRMMWSFMNVLKYCVLNPCSILKIFHYHCSHLRSHLHRNHLDRREHYTLRGPTGKLYCSK
jgi:hypothetical protein